MAATEVVMGAVFLLLLFQAAYSAVSDASADVGRTPENIEQVVNRVFAPLPFYVDPLPNMPVVQGYNLVLGIPIPKHVTIGMYEIKWNFHSSLPDTTVFSYGETAATATFPGPTIKALRGVGTWVTWLNFLPAKHILPWDPTIDVAVAGSGVPTVVHVHGGVVAPADDGYAFSWFTNNFSTKGPAWTKPTYTYPNFQGPGNLMYHDHALGLTRENILAGLLGAYVTGRFP